jgi:hypothetical protein
MSDNNWFIYRRKTDRYNAGRNTTNTAHSRHGYRNSWIDNITYSSNQGNLFCFFIKPKLDIHLGFIGENTELRWGPLVERSGRYAPNGTWILPPISFYPLRRFVNVVVENKGKAVAKNCEVKLRLLNRTVGCQAPSPEEKALMWNDNLEEKIDISAKYGKRSFTLTFSQEKFTQDQTNSIGELYCGAVNQNITVCTWIGTQRALVTPENYNQDSLCQGEFRVHLDVITETGQKVSSDSIIRVGDHWTDLTAEMMTCDCPRV